MIMSLKWVQKEILAFGGDPSRVTLMGNSAGASTIQFLSVSPAVPRDYYSNIVISSGSPTIFNGFNHSATNSIVKQSGVSFLFFSYKDKNFSALKMFLIQIISRK